MILVIYAHPYPARSRACAALLNAIRDVEGVEIRSLYDLYPDFDIDGPAERTALDRARLIVWLHPLYWYSVPALLKHYFDHVMIQGWAHGSGGEALAGKHCLWVSTSGGDEDAFSAQGRHGHAFEAFAAPVQQTAQYCGMTWLPPMTLRGSHSVPEQALHEAGARLRAQLEAWIASSKATRLA